MDKLGFVSIDFSALNLHEILSFSGILTSVVLIGSIILLRSFGIRYIRKDAEILDKDQRRWIIRIKNACAITMLIGLILIWAPQLHTFAISIAAFAVALVVATKEMILCLTGAIMRATSQPFRVGEWITIDGVTGEVIDLDAFAFRLQEVDMEGKSYQYTGRTITVPNAKLFTASIENANFFKTYIFEDVRVAVQFTDINPTAALEELQIITERHFAPQRENAVAYNRKIRRRAGIEIASAEPAFDLTTSDLGHYKFHARLFLPTILASKIGTDVSREFLTRIHNMRKEVAQDKKEAEAARQAEETVSAPATA